MVRLFLPVILTLMCLASTARPVAAGWPTDPAIGVSLCNAPNAQETSAIVPDGFGGAIVCWQDFRNIGIDVYVQRVDPAGVPVWTANGVAVCTAASSQLASAIASDGTGGVIVVWYDYRSQSGNNFDIYAQRVNAAGVAQWTSNGVAICSAANEQAHPKIVPDGAGGAFIVWHDRRTGADLDVYAQRVSASGVALWTANGVALSTAGGDQAYPQIVSDGTGGATVVWTDVRSGDADVYAQRVGPAGVPQWTAGGVALCVAPGHQHEPSVATDGAGGAVVAWKDERGEAPDIFAQRVSASGTPEWSANGVPLSTASGTQDLPAIASDGGGGAIVAWRDAGGAYPYVFARRVNASGVPQWAQDVALNGGAVEQTDSPAIVADGVGGAIVTWWDTRNGVDADLFAQRVDGGGDPLWTAGGAAVSTALHDQMEPAIVSDGEGGAILAWQDRRTGDDHPFNDIYAQRVDASGQLGPGTPPLEVGDDEAGVSFAAPSPNPARTASALRWTLAKLGRVRVTMSDAAGRLVRVVFDGVLPAGPHRVGFELQDGAGRPLASGVYVIRLEAEGRSLSRRLVAIR